MRSFTPRGPGGRWAYGLAGVIALCCTPALFAQVRTGAGGVGAGMSSGGGGFGGGGSFGGGFGGGGSSGGFGGGGSFGGGTSFQGGISSGSNNTAFTGGITTGSSTSFSGGITTGTGAGASGFQGGQTSTPSIGATSTGGVSSSNPFASYYANPLAAGLTGTTTSRSTFGKAIYATLNSTGSMTGTGGMSAAGGMGAAGARPGGMTGFGGMGGGFAGLSSMGGSYGAAAYGTTGTTGASTTAHRAPTYSASLGFSSPSPVPSGLQTNLQQMLSRSTSLGSSPTIKVVIDGSTVVLQGSVADDHDRTLAEGMVRLTPGVHDVRNELQVAGSQRASPGP